MKNEIEENFEASVRRKVEFNQEDVRDWEGRVKRGLVTAEQARPYIEMAMGHIRVAQTILGVIEPS
jgi:hypothetical protein